MRQPLADMLPYLPLIALAAGALAVLVLVWLWLSMRRASAPQPDKTAEAAGTATHNADAPITSAGSIRQSFRAALRTLKRMSNGRRYRYSLPWFLVLGASGSGKTALVESASSVLGTSGALKGARVAGGGLTWWFFDRGVVLDATGGLTADARGDDSGWSRFLNHLVGARPSRPLDGVIITLPVEALIGEGGTEQIVATADFWNHRLWEMQKKLGLVLPVYLVVTRCDAVSGFSGFWANVPPSGRHAMFGWSAPYSPEISYSPAWVPEAFSSIRRSLNRAQLEFAGVPRTGGDPSDMMLFPAHFDGVEARLQVFLDTLLQASNYYDTVPLRGIYFTGAGPNDEDTTLEQMVSSEAMPQQPILCGDLFADKIFRENNLAIPLRRTLMSRNRAVIAAQAVLAVTLLICGIGFAFNYHDLRQSTATLRPIVGQVAQAVAAMKVKEQQARNLSAATATDITFFRQEDALQLLDLMAKIQGTSLRPVFMPTSLGSNIDEDLAVFLSKGFGSVILRAMYNELDQRMRHALAEAERAAADGSTTNGTVAASATSGGSGSLGALQGFVAEVRRIEDLAALYNSLGQTQDVESMGRLVQGLFGTELPQSFLTYQDLFKSVLRDTQYEAFDVEAYRGKAMARARSLMWQLYNRMFQSGPLNRAVEGLAVQVHSLNADERTIDQEALALDRTRAALQTAVTLLSQPDMAWISEPRLNLGDAMSSALNSVAASALFDPSFADELLSAGQSEFERFRTRLASYEAPLVGPILTTSGDRPLSRLSPDLMALHGALDQLFSQDFMRVPADAAINPEYDTQRGLTWNIEKLRSSLAFYETYDTYIAQHLQGFPDALRSRIQDLALARLERNMTSAVATAQVADAARSDTASHLTSEATLANSVRNFRAAAPIIERLLTVFRQFDMVTSISALQSVAVQQAEYLLFLTDLQLESDYLFSPLRPYDEWDGATPANRFAFMVSDVVEMQRFIDLERSRLQFLFTEYAQPLVEFLSAQGGSRMPQDREVLVRWQRLYETLAAYNAHRPQNSMTRLEQFLRTDITRAECGTLESLGGDSGDFLQQRRFDLQQSIADRCEMLASDGFLASYRALGRRFNDHLSGRFPFAAADAAEDASIDDVRSFFAEVGPVIDELRQQVPVLTRAGQRREIGQFLDQLAATRDFLTALDGEFAGAGTPPMAIVGAAFRTNRQAERGGNQIIEWRMSIGSSNLGMFDDKPLSWRAGEPVSFSLRWAKDSPTVPADRDGPGLPTIHDGQAIFGFHGRWALLRAVASLKAVPLDGPSGSDRSILLGLTVPMEAAGSVNGETSHVFIRLDIGVADSNAGGRFKPLAVPQFPWAAPSADRGLASVSTNGGRVR